MINPVRKNIPFDETRSFACIEDCNETLCGSPGYSDIGVDLLIPFGITKMVSGSPQRLNLFQGRGRLRIFGEKSSSELEWGLVEDCFFGL